MATLLQHRSRVLIGLGLAVLLACPGPAASGAPVDAVLAEVDGTLVAASDVALSRAFGLFGFTPSAAPILAPEVERFVDILLELQEADRLRIEVPAAERDAAWADLAERRGGPGALAAWLDGLGIDMAWPRRLLESHLVHRRFLAVRFRAFTFVTEAEVADALGPGAHSPEARERARTDLAERAAEQSRASWRLAARAQARIVRTALPLEGLPCPLPMPPLPDRP